MRKRIETKQEKLEFIIRELKRLKGLEFIDDDEVSAVNYACLILRNRIKELDKIEPYKETNVKYIKNCKVSKSCNACYRKYVCMQESTGEKL